MKKFFIFFILVFFNINIYTQQYDHIELRVTVQTMLRDFSQNKVAFDVKYKEKVVAVTGTVHGIDQSVSNPNFYIVRLNHSRSMGIYDEVYCAFNVKQLEHILTLRVSQEITIAGIARRNLWVPELHDCIIIN